MPARSRRRNLPLFVTSASSHGMSYQPGRRAGVLRRGSTGGRTTTTPSTPTVIRGSRLCGNPGPGDLRRAGRDLLNFSLKPHKITEIAAECAAWTWGEDARAGP